jgi:peptidoglycan/xylan/chitin deacetylase (PgdA/CDA1 family)
MRNILILITLILTHSLYSQKRVAFSFDDVPNTKNYELNLFQSKLLDQITSLKIPSAIFINEGLLEKTAHRAKNQDLLNKWAKNYLITLGNHSYSHFRYSTVGLQKFSADILKGESITRELAEKYKKELKYFRFPYNDLGSDSIQQVQIEQFLSKHQYISTPFTVESSDWVFNYLYKHYLKANNLEKAKQIGEQYVSTTLKYFDYFDSLAIVSYGREINQIYLCHDNSINADYFSELISKLKQKEYEFISMDEAMQDEVYAQPNLYKKKWGISWFYRWMKNHKARIDLMRNEPDMKEIYKEYESLIKN